MSIPIMPRGELAILAVAAATHAATADFVGWTACARPVAHGYLINVFAATNDPGDTLLNVNGGAGFWGRILTLSNGGLRQGLGAQGTFAPAGSQSWTALDSFLTCGGGFNTTTNAWTANSATLGDPQWDVTYIDTDIGEETWVNAFNTPSNTSGFVNPYTTSVAQAGGWFLAGTSSPARSLSSLPNRVSSSSPAAGTAQFGVMVAQLYVETADVYFRMVATMRRQNGSLSSIGSVLWISPSMVDWDGDGTPDQYDACPTVQGPCAGCPDPCPCPTDLTGDRAVGGDDLGLLLGAWGPCGSGTGCAADLTADGIVDGADLGVMLGDWGSCD